MNTKNTLKGSLGLSLDGLEDFKNYLIKQEYSDRTLQEHIANIRRVEQWKKENDYRADALTYNELLTYISYLQSRKLKPQSINTRLQSVRIYYEYLKEYEYININTARALRVKGTAKTVTVNAFNHEELQNLYQCYIQYKKEKKSIYRSEKQQYHTYHKHIVLLGLIIYQGINTSELGTLQTKDIDMEKGVMNLHGAKRLNARILKLEPFQILPLSNYLNTLPANQEKLFKEHAVGIVFGVLEELKGVNPTIYSINQLRASVIMNWIKLYGKRKAQYLAGHKYITSTEKYEHQNIDGLTDLLKKHHPFG